MKQAGLFICVLFFFACNNNNIKEDDSLEKYFDANHVTGCFAMFNNAQGIFTIYNLKTYTDSAYLPASTFKIVNSLVGLQTGIISDEKMVIPWDGVTRSNPEWNKDLTMQQAFKTSAVPYYQEVARRIGKDTMQHWLDSLGYAEKYHKPKIKIIDSFWLNNEIKITADEQLGLVKKLYFNQLPFQKRTQEIVKKVMLQEDNASYKLSYKTGLGYTENGDAIGWITGWLNKDKNVYPFVLLVKGAHDTDMQNIRMNILNNIFKQYELK